METENYAAAAFKKHSDTVYRLAFARLKNKNDADDVLQEVFLRYLKQGKPASCDEHEKALLIRITLNCTKTLLSTNNKHRTEELYDNIPCSEAPQSYTLDAVFKLPLKYRTAIHLHYYCGYSVVEIAKITGCRPSTVRSHLFRAREKLKKELEGDAAYV